MKKLTAAMRLVLADLAKLRVPSIAAAVAGPVVPLVVALVGVDVTAAEVGGWLTIAGAAAAMLQKLASGQAAAHAAAPPPPAPPAPQPIRPSPMVGETRDNGDA